MPNRDSEIHFARLTGEGRGAIATTCVFGNGARRLVAKYFRPFGKKRLETIPVGSLVYGLWVGFVDQSRTEGSPSEDLVVTILADDYVEIHSHGGNMSSSQIALDLMNAGALSVDASQFMRTHSENFWDFELQSALLKAETEFAARLILTQQGVWRSTLEDWKQANEKDDYSSIQNSIAKTLLWARLARHVLEPWSVVLRGKPNVGKSSLINAMVGFERAIVNPMPGTTRDVLRQRTALDGWPIQLSDTAGVRELADELEATAIERGRTESQAADCLIDVSAIDDSQMPEFGNARMADLFVCNKMDLGPQPASDGKTIFVSAKKGTNVDELLKRVIGFLVPEMPPPDQPLPITAAMFERLQQGHALLNVGTSRDELQLHLPRLLFDSV